MKIICLMENTSRYCDIEAQHGLSFYIEWNDRKILFDTGASKRFLNNAFKRNVDLKAVDTLILSHGHYDHSGGIGGFLEQNERAALYMREKALEPHFSIKGGNVLEIGIPESVLKWLNNPSQKSRIHFTGVYEQLQEGCFLFSDVTGNRFYSKGNDGLSVWDGNRYKKDDFLHEQNLVLEENGKLVLFSGCSHSGVINIMEKCKQLFGKEPDVLIGGFHFEKPKEDGSVDTEFIEAIGSELQTYNTKYYTCHCTRVACYQYLKKLMKDQVDYIGAGDQLEL